jgi:transcriptional regulator
MYIPELYKNENQEEIRQFINDNGFAILVNQTNGKPWATHIPLILDFNDSGKDVLIGHISKENPQAESFKKNGNVLAIFSGPHAYISSSWYDHENVPTWNYLAIHVYGKITILDYEQSILSLKKLVDKYEANSVNPIKIEELSQKTMNQAKGIVAFKIEIISIESVKKISQNRDNQNFENIISELEKNDETHSKEIAKIMKKCSRK